MAREGDVKMAMRRVPLAPTRCSEISIERLPWLPMEVRAVKSLTFSPWMHFWLAVVNAVDETMSSMSLMFPTIYGIALEGMGEEAKVASAGLIFAIVGGALMPTWQGRVKALDALLKTAHELYVMALIADALNARARPLPWSSEPYWALEFASDYPSVILDSECGTFTIWYQFSIKPWFDVVREAIVEWIRGGEKHILKLLGLCNVPSISTALSASFTVYTLLKHSPVAQPVQTNVFAVER